MSDVCYREEKEVDPEEQIQFKTKMGKAEHYIYDYSTALAF